MSLFGWLGLDGTYTRKQNRQGIGVLAGAKTTARPLGCRSGITSVPSLAVTGSTWTVGSFTAALDLETDATMGVTAAVFDGGGTGSVTAASGSFDRWDLLSVTYADAGPTAPEIVYTAGTVATTLPTLPSNSMALAKIVVPKSGTGSPTIQLIAPFAVAAGGIIPCADSTTYPADNSQGRYLDDATYGLLRDSGSGFATATALTSLWMGRQSTPGSVPNNAYTTVVMDTLDVNTTGVAVGGGSWRAPVAGFYELSGSVKFDNNTTGVRGGRFVLTPFGGSPSGVAGSQVQVPASGGSDSTYVTMPTVLVGPLGVGDVISLQAYQDSGGSLSLVSGSIMCIKRC